MNERLSRYLIKRTDKTAIQFFRYIFVGGFATVIDMGSLFILAQILGIYYLIAAALAFVLGLITNYSLSIFWVFESTKNIKKEFTLFAIIGIGGLIWTEIILWALVDKINLPIMLSKAVAVILVLIWNFGMRKKFVFKNSISAYG